MTQRSSPTKPKNSRRASSEHPDDHQTTASASSTISPQVVDQESEEKTQNPLPTLVVLLINLAIIYLGTLLLDERVLIIMYNASGKCARCDLPLFDGLSYYLAFCISSDV